MMGCWPIIDLAKMLVLSLRQHHWRASRLLRWWKMKTQEHRTLDTDEAKALRMVIIAWCKGVDYDNDPETHLPDLR